MRYTLAVIPLILIGIGASRAEPAARTTEQVEQRQHPRADAQAIGTLKRNSELGVLQRQLGWYQVNSLLGTGWLPLFSVRFAQQQASRLDLGSANASTPRGKLPSNFTVTSGVRGLSAADLVAAAPNPERAQQLEAFAVTPEQAGNFAQAAGLSKP